MFFCFVFLSFFLVFFLFFFFFFFNDTATTEIYTLSLHDALPISSPSGVLTIAQRKPLAPSSSATPAGDLCRSEEHTSELQSLAYLVCRLLLEKKKKKQYKKKKKKKHKKKKNKKK